MRVGVVVLTALRQIGNTKAVLGAGDLSASFGNDTGAVVVEFGR